tara:strand:- start:163 stop:426 length:264 start_codon:yes stop_codon:yes gene_type:complete
MSEHPTLEDGTEGPYDITVDGLIERLQKFRKKHGNLPAEVMWGTTRYGSCHWDGQVSLIHHKITSEECGGDFESLDGPVESLLISIY